MSDFEVVTDPEEIRKAIDEDLLGYDPKPAKYPYKVVGGTLVKEEPPENS